MSRLNARTACRTFGALAAGLAVLCVAGFSSGGQNPRSWTLDQWIAWRDAEITGILEPGIQVQNDRILSRQDVIDRSVEPYLVVAECQRSNPDYFSKGPLSKEMSNFVRFVTAQHWMAIQGTDGFSTNALGYEVSDAQYWNAAKENLRFPPLLASQSFLNDLGNPAGYRSAVDRIEELNASLPDDRKWLVLPFLSQFIMSADRSTYGRLLVFVPNDPLPDGRVVDRWIQFAIAAPESTQGKDIRSVSMVAIVKSDPGNKTFLMDFLRIKDPASGQIAVVPTAILHHDPSNNCYDCHKAGVIPVRPEREYGFDEAGGLVAKSAGSGSIPKVLNDRIRDYGQIDLGWMDADAYGPSLGPDIPRSDAFIRRASGMNLSDDSVQRIRSAMNCASCHDLFAKLNYPLAMRSSRDLKGFKSALGLGPSFVEKGWMPPGNSLSEPERHALWLALTKEYFDPDQKTGLLVDWLRGKS